MVDSSGTAVAPLGPGWVPDGIRIVGKAGGSPDTLCSGLLRRQYAMTYKGFSLAAAVLFAATITTQAAAQSCTGNNCSVNNTASVSVPSVMRLTLNSATTRSEEHTSELQSPCNIVCRLLLEKKKTFIAQTVLVSHRTMLPE